MTLFTKKFWFFNLIFTIGILCLSGICVYLVRQAHGDAVFGLIGVFIVFLCFFIPYLISIYVGLVLTVNPWFEKNNIVGFRKYFYILILGPLCYSFVVFYTFAPLLMR